MAFFFSHFLRYRTQGYLLGTGLGPIATPEPANLAWGDAGYGALYITVTTSVHRLKTKARGFVPYVSNSLRKPDEEGHFPDLEQVSFMAVRRQPKR